MLIDTSVRGILAAFASSDPTPGGGSASALAGAIGASLLAMVAGLPKTRTGSPDDRAALDAAAAALAAIREQLAAAVDADTGAYDQVVAAYKRPKGTDDEKAARTIAIQSALRAATDVPLGVMRLCADALGQAAAVAAHGHKAASSDVGVAIALLRAGLHGARLNVDINIGGIVDAAYKNRVGMELETIDRDARAAAEVAERTLTV